MITTGYLVMRIGLIALWLRARIDDPDRRRTGIRYAVGLGAPLASPDGLPTGALGKWSPFVLDVPGAEAPIRPTRA
jgi:hypothetical protein